MKRMIMLTIVMVTMLVSLGGCYLGHWQDRGGGHGRYWNDGYHNDRGGHDHHRNGGYYHDRGRGGHDRPWNGKYYYDRN